MNKRNQQIELALRYQSHYVRLGLAIHKSMLYFNQLFLQLIEIMSNNTHDNNVPALLEQYNGIILDKIMYVEFLTLIGEARLSFAIEIYNKSNYMFEKIKLINEKLEKIHKKLGRDLKNNNVYKLDDKELERLKDVIQEHTNWFINNGSKDIVKIYQNHTRVLSG